MAFAAVYGRGHRRFLPTFDLAVPRAAPCRAHDHVERCPTRWQSGVESTRALGNTRLRENLDQFIWERSFEQRRHVAQGDGG